VRVTFRLIVFRPFKGEVLTGRISSSSHHGINVRTDFFDEIFIPDTYLFEGSTYDVAENVWVWNNEGNQFYMDKNEVIRFRVEEEAFEDQLPVPPHLQEGSREEERKPPYRIIVSSYLAEGGRLRADEDTIGFRTAGWYGFGGVVGRGGRRGGAGRGGGRRVGPGDDTTLFTT
jgi:DNA-directed RNA polymerase III subunit RPC8